MGVRNWRCTITRWVGDDPQPGIVEARAHDAEGREWVFVDKSAVFSALTLTRTTNYPVDGIIGCEVLLEGPRVSRVSTVWSAGRSAEDGPFDALYTEGETEFDVLTVNLLDPDSSG